MGKSSPKPPAAPDPAKTAGAQGAANVDAAIASALMNNVNQNTPYGNITYNQTGTQTVGTGKDARQVPLYSANTTLNAQDQQLLDRQRALGGALTGAAQNMAQYLSTDKFSMDGLPQAPGTGDFSAERGNVEKAYFDRSMGMLSPQFEQDRRRTEQNLANRGLPIDGEAYGTATGNLDRSQNEAKLNAANQAVLAGGQEQSRLFGEANTVRQQAINEALTQRAQPFNELSAFLQGSPAINNPNPVNTPAYNVAAPDVMAATALQYQAQQNAYNQQMAQNNSAMGGLFGLGGSLATAGIMKYSDARLKTNIVLLGKHKDFTWYAFKYLWSPVQHFGVMAQEVMEKLPSAVKDIGGYMAVDYAALEA